MTFVHATFVLATFVHISNISAVADPILTKLLYPIFGALIFVDHIFLTKLLQAQNFFGKIGSVPGQMSPCQLAFV